MLQAICWPIYRLKKCLPNKSHKAHRITYAAHIKPAAASSIFRSARNLNRICKRNPLLVFRWLRVFLKHGIRPSYNMHCTYRIIYILNSHIPHTFGKEKNVKIKINCCVSYNALCPQSAGSMYTRLLYTRYMVWAPPNTAKRTWNLGSYMIHVQVFMKVASRYIMWPMIMLRYSFY